MDLDALHIPHA